MKNRRRTVPGAAAFLGACVMLVPLAGCQLLALPWLMWGNEPTKPVAAEYPYLAGKKACVVVWAEPETTFEYPNVQFELSEFVVDTISRNVKNVSFTPSRRVIEFQRAGPEWERMDPAKIGQHFGVERVIVVELTQYGTREPDSPHLYRGRIHANVKVYDAAYPEHAPAYKTTMEVAYPPDSPGRWGSDDRVVRRGVMEAFGDTLAKKFYDHRIKVK